MKRAFIHTITAVFALLVISAAPAFAATPGFNVDCSGTAQITGSGPNGPTQATFGGPCNGSHLGQGQLHGVMNVVGPASCSGGFMGAHTDTLSAGNGDSVTMSVSESACPIAPNSTTYNCSGTYTVISSTGSFSKDAGSGGKWMGQVTFSTTNPSTETFHSTYSI